MSELMPKKSKSSIAKTTASPLEIITANTMSLYMLAKNFHLNVTGPSFYGAHKTFDGIADMAIEWFDTLAERMRALEMPVCSHPMWVMDMCMMDRSADENSSCEEMLDCMLSSLENVSTYICANGPSMDPTTDNMLQELDRDIGKQMYFVRSSL